MSPRRYSHHEAVTGEFRLLRAVWKTFSQGLRDALEAASARRLRVQVGLSTARVLPTANSWDRNPARVFGDVRGLEAPTKRARLSPELNLVQPCVRTHRRRAVAVSSSPESTRYGGDVQTHGWLSCKHRLFTRARTASSLHGRSFAPPMSASVNELSRRTPQSLARRARPARQVSAARSKPTTRCLTPKRCRFVSRGQNRRRAAELHAACVRDGRRRQEFATGSRVRALASKATRN